MILIFYAIIFQGSIYYLSEICFLTWLSFIFYNKNLKFSTFRLTFMITTISAVILTNLNIDYKTLLLLCSFALINSVSRIKLNTFFDRSYNNFTKFYCITSLILFIDTLIFGVPKLADFFCIYGDRAWAYQSCAVQTHYISGYPFARTYGITAEPAVLATLILFFMLFERMSKTTLPARTQQMRLVTFFLTFSVTGYFLGLLIYLVLNIRNPLKFISYFKDAKIVLAIFFFVLAIIFVFPEYVYIFYQRTVLRVFELFAGTDLSAFKRSVATFQPFVHKFTDISKWLDAPGIPATLNYLSELTFITNIDGRMVSVRGQNTNSFVLLFLSLGIWSFIFFFSLLRIRKLSVTFLMIIILSFTSIVFSLSFIAMIGIMSLYRERRT